MHNLIGPFFNFNYSISHSLYSFSLFLNKIEKGKWRVTKIFVHLFEVWLSLSRRGGDFESYKLDFLLVLYYFSSSFVFFFYVWFPRKCKRKSCWNLQSQIHCYGISTQLCLLCWNLQVKIYCCGFTHLYLVAKKIGRKHQNSNP